MSCPGRTAQHQETGYVGPPPQPAARFGGEAATATQGRPVGEVDEWTSST